MVSTVHLSNLIDLLQNCYTLISRWWADRRLPFPRSTPHLCRQKPMIRNGSAEVVQALSQAFRGLGSLQVVGGLQAGMWIGSFDRCHGFFMFLNLLLEDHFCVAWWSYVPESEILLIIINIIKSFPSIIIWGRTCSTNVFQFVVFGSLYLWV